MGTPSFLFTDGDAAHANLFADAYQPDTPVTLGPTGVGTTSATLNGSVNPQEAAVNVSFQFGATTACGQTTAAQKTAASNSTVGFSAKLTGLAPATTIHYHYRAVATSDFGTFVGADQTLKTATPPPPPGPGHTSVGKAKVRGTTASVRASCKGAAGATCKLVLRMTVTEKIRSHKIIAITARKRQKTRKVVVTVGSARGLTLLARQSKVVKISLNGRRTQHPAALALRRQVRRHL